MAVLTPLGGGRFFNPETQQVVDANGIPLAPAAAQPNIYDPAALEASRFDYQDRSRTFNRMLQAGPQWDLMGGQLRDVATEKFDPISTRFWLSRLNPAQFGGDVAGQQFAMGQAGEGAPTFRQFSEAAVSGKGWGTADWTQAVDILTKGNALPPTIKGYKDMSSEEQNAAMVKFTDQMDPNASSHFNSMTNSEVYELVLGMIGADSLPPMVKEWLPNALGKEFAKMERSMPGLTQSPRKLLLHIAMSGWDVNGLGVVPEGREEVDIANIGKVQASSDAASKAKQIVAKSLQNNVKPSQAAGEPEPDEFTLNDRAKANLDPKVTQAIEASKSGNTADVVQALEGLTDFGTDFTSPTGGTALGDQEEFLTPAEKAARAAQADALGGAYKTPEVPGPMTGPQTGPPSAIGDVVPGSMADITTPDPSLGGFPSLPNNPNNIINTNPNAGILTGMGEGDFTNKPPLTTLPPASPPAITTNIDSPVIPGLGQTDFNKPAPPPQIINRPNKPAPPLNFLPNNPNNVITTNPNADIVQGLGNGDFTNMPPPTNGGVNVNNLLSPPPGANITSDKNPLLLDIPPNLPNNPNNVITTNPNADIVQGLGNGDFTNKPPIVSTPPPIVSTPPPITTNINTTPLPGLGNGDFTNMPPATPPPATPPPVVVVQPSAPVAPPSSLGGVMDMDTYADDLMKGGYSNKPNTSIGNQEYDMVDYLDEWNQPPF